MAAKMVVWFHLVVLMLAISCSTTFSPSDNHRNAIRAKSHVLTDIKIINCLNQSDTAHLKQVVHILAPAQELLDHGENQPEVPGDQFLSGVHISLLGSTEQIGDFVA